MTGPAPFALASLPAAPVDPVSVTLHLEVCRLQAELDLLERRIGALQVSQGAPGESDAAAPFAHRAEELVERMVTSLLQAGREEIDATSDRRRRDAEAVLDDARRRADDIVDGARAQLATALADRSRAVDAARVVDLDVVVLDDRALAPTVPAPAALAPVAAAPVVEVPAPVAPAPVGPMTVPAEPGPAPALEARPGPRTHPVVSAIEAEEARTDAAFDAWLAVGPIPDTPEPVVAPVAAVAEAVAAVAEDPSRSRSRWLLPVEVLGALLATVLVVVVVLVLVG